MRQAWRWWRIASVALALAVTAPVVLPNALQAFQLWWWWNTPIEKIEDQEEFIDSDEPSVLIDYHLKGIRPAEYENNIEGALEAGDSELAASILEVSRQRQVDLNPDLLRQVAELQPDGLATDIWEGVKGEADSPAGFATELTMDLFVVGDLRDLAAQAWAIPDHDYVIIALSAVGIGASVATYASVGATGPAKVGISVFKIGRRLGKLNAKLLGDLLNLTRNAVNLGALQEIANRASRLDWSGVTAAAARIVDKDVSDKLMSSGNAVGRLAKARGPNATLETLNIAETTKDLATLGKIGEKSGSGYRGVLKLSGGKILGPVKKIGKVRKLVKRGSMMLETMASIAGWLLSGLVWFASLVWTLIKITWRLLRFGFRSHIAPLPDHKG